MKKMINIKEASNIFGLSEYEIRIGIKNGRYPFYRIGQKRGKYLIDYELFANELKKASMNNMANASQSALSSEIINPDIYGKLRRVSK
ncbi:MAG: hypothetical protein FWD71_11365 [Oscillospiraceae bacterium]|nr:hypothetical protein [Oscillospiraceae bacterium]